MRRESKDRCALCPCRRVLAALLCVAAVCAPAARAATLATYDFEGSSLAASGVAAGLSAADLAYAGGGTTAFVAGHDSAVSYRSTIWPTDATPVDYFGFSLTVEQGYLVEIHSLTFVEQHSSEGPTNWLVRVSTNGTTFVDLGVGTSTSVDIWHSQSAGDFPVLNVTGTIHFRLYATDAVSGDGTWRIDDVQVNGIAPVDTALRTIRYQGFDNSVMDTWTFTTNSGPLQVAESSVRTYLGKQALRLTGSTDGLTNAVIDLATLDVADLEQLSVSVAFSADGPDIDDDLYLDVSTNAWVTAQLVKIVDGFDDADVAFGATAPTNPTTVASNPYTLSLPGGQTQVMVRVRYDDRNGENNSIDDFYVDDIRLLGIPPLAVAAPVISYYGRPSAIGTGSAALSGHVRGGFPYPRVSLFYGLADGGTNTSDWSHELDMGTQSWGTFTHILLGLGPGHVYYYRFLAESSSGFDWTDTTIAFTNTLTSLNGVRRLYVDGFGVDTNMPLHIDADGNGLPDRWEIEEFGQTGHDPDTDTDNDGVDDGLEFLAGTDPGDTNSRMRIVGIDLASEAGSDVQISVSGGDYMLPSVFVGDASQTRSYIVRAADNDPAVAKSLIGSVADGGTGINVFTDTGAAALYTRRFYEVAVSQGGVSYTNTEEWAMHVQPRVASRQYLVCVPVRYGGTNDNFQGTLGTQLARGLYRASNTGDVVRFWTTNGSWVSCLLTTNAQGDVQWTTNGSPADIDVTPGMAMWVYRSSGAAARADTVFMGKSFAASDTVTTTFKTNSGGWTAFGWPLPQSRSHSSADASPDQLGFYSVGTGGRVSTTDKSKLGDQIWIWRDNTWQGFYSLLDHVGAGWDGRWWDNNRRRLADFSLEPGAAYYYRHSTNWSATDFMWEPTLP